MIPNNNIDEMVKYPMEKLKKIDHIYLEIIREREEKGETEGLKIVARNKPELIKKLGIVFGEVFIESKKTLRDVPEDIMGLHFLVAMLRKLPLENIKQGEKAVSMAIKKKRELQRQEIDQGNIDKLIRGEI
jgi:hypothetical protein